MSQCPRCHTTLPPDSGQCPRCGLRIRTSDGWDGDFAGEPGYSDGTQEKPSRLPIVLASVLSLAVAGGLAYWLLISPDGDGTASDENQVAAVDDGNSEQDPHRFPKSKEDEPIQEDPAPSAPQEAGSPDDGDEEADDGEPAEAMEPADEKMLEDVPGTWYLYSMNMGQDEMTDIELIKQSYQTYSKENLCLIVGKDQSMELKMMSTDSKGSWTLQSSGKGHGLLNNEKVDILYDGIYLTLTDSTGSIIFTRRPLV